MSCMARVLLLCLLVLGFAAQLVPASAGPMGQMHSGAAMDMADCLDCPMGSPAASEACQGSGVCAAAPTALPVLDTAEVFAPRLHDLWFAQFQDASPSGDPAPLLEPPRPLI